MKIQRLKLSSLTPADFNPREDLRPDDPRFLALARSIDTFGLVQPLVFNRRTKTLIGGHQRLRILLARGEEYAETVVLDLSPTKEKALNLALNRISGGWDKDKLSVLLEELVRTPEFDLEITGFQPPEVEQLLLNHQADEGADEDFDLHAELESSAPTVTQPGDLIVLGRNGQHRLLCGDAANAHDIRRLLGHERAHLLNTDPPYGINYDSTRRPSVAKKSAARCQATARLPRNSRLINDDLPTEQYSAWLERVIEPWQFALHPGAAFYVWNSARKFGRMIDILVARNFHVASTLVWAKESASLTFGDYHEQVEHCVYGWRKGAPHKFYGPRNESSLWAERRDRTSFYRHPTQKALGLAERAIRNSSRAGEIVLDPFLGSGTTLIAAARLGRRGYGLEIDPRFCDAVVRRFIALAGKGAVPAKTAARYQIKKSA